MTLEISLLIMFAAALAVSTLGFFKTVYFVSIGYGFSMAAQAILLIVVYRSGAPMLAFVQAGLLAAYGLRLSGYLTIRESKAAYGREKKDADARSVGMGIGRKLMIWVSVALLYMTMAVSALFHLRSGGGASGPLAAAGIAVMVIGLALETLADLRKNSYKKKNPDRFCDAGIYRFVRCPNYLGELIFWAGNLLAGAAFLEGFLAWSMAIVAWACITLIMVGSAKRLEARQEERYGDREDFRQWCSSTPVLFPLIPVYSLKNVKVYLE